MGHPSEGQEWVEARTLAWVEQYKKAMLTPVILQVVGRQAGIPVDAIAQRLIQLTGWRLTERGLYRTLKRLSDDGLLSVTAEPVARTGVRRHLFSLTDLGGALLAGMQANTVSLDADGGH